MAQQRWLTRQQAADYLGVSLRFIDRKAETGDLPVYRIGPRSRRFTTEDLDKLVQPDVPAGDS